MLSKFIEEPEYTCHYAEHLVPFTALRTVQLCIILCIRVVDHHNLKNVTKMCVLFGEFSISYVSARDEFNTWPLILWLEKKAGNFPSLLNY